MKKLLLSLLLLISIHCLYAQRIKQKFVSTDIDNFWEAYERISNTKDTVLQYEYLQKLYIDRGSVGLKKIMQARNYTAKSYIDAINNYPKFWKSIKENSFQAKTLNSDIELGIVQLKNIYPELKPAAIYFTMGAFRTNGTTEGKNILIGAEMALASKNTIGTEFPAELAHVPAYFSENPIKNIVLLCTHEYVHTQQKKLVENLLMSAIYEGVAEFVSCKATGRASTVPAIAYGKMNEIKVKKKFEEDLYREGVLYNWLWGTNKNELKVRDLGYYIGYAICEKNYEQAKDKKAAIKEMIELDYENEKLIENFIDRAKFFSASISSFYKKYDKSRPVVLSISEFKNGSKTIDPALTLITLNFSASMDKNARGFDFGPLGEANVLKVLNVIGFSEDGKSFSFEVDLEPNKRYQSLVNNRFKTADGIALKPYLIDITTAAR